MGVLVVPLTPPRSNVSLPGPGEPCSPRRRLAEVIKLHGAGDMAGMSDEEEEYLSEALGDWVCEKLIFSALSARLEAFLISTTDQRQLESLRELGLEVRSRRHGGPTSQNHILTKNQLSIHYSVSVFIYK